MNGSMRLGAFSTMLVADSKVADIYGKTVVSERHRHRFEFNNKYKNEFEKAGMIFSGISEDLHFADVVELPDHPWFVGCSSILSSIHRCSIRTRCLFLLLMRQSIIAKQIHQKD